MGGQLGERLAVRQDGPRRTAEERVVPHAEEAGQHLMTRLNIERCLAERPCSTTESHRSQWTEWEYFSFRSLMHHCDFGQHAVGHSSRCSAPGDTRTLKLTGRFSSKGAVWKCSSTDQAPSRNLRYQKRISIRKLNRYNISVLLQHFDCVDQPAGRGMRVAREGGERADGGVLTSARCQSRTAGTAGPLQRRW